MIIRKCAICGKDVKVYPSELKMEKTCSKKCSNLAHSRRMKGCTPWHKGRTGVYSSEQIEKMRKRMADKSGEKSYSWTGDKVGYHGLHAWVWKTLGKPIKCEYCDTKETYRYEWSNKSGEYKRDVSDWEQLCVKCHRKKDDNVNKMWTIRHKNAKMLIV